MKKFCIVMLVLAVAVCGFSACGDKKPEKIKYIENYAILLTAIANLDIFLAAVFLW